MSLFGKSAVGHVRKIEGGKCVDYPMSLKVRGGIVIAKDMRMLSRSKPIEIRPVEVSMFADSGVLNRKEHGTRDLWYLYVRDDSGLLHEFRVQEFTGKAIKKQIEKIIESGN